MQDKTLIIVPTYNECDNVVEVTKRFLQPVDAAELLFVDDNSPDGTGGLLDQIAAQNDRVHVLHREQKQGLGSAYRDGFRWALARPFGFIFAMDADFSHAPEDIPRLLHPAQQGIDMVVGSRYVAGGATRNWGWRRKLLSRAGSMYAQAILGIGVRDVTSGFICYRRDTLLRLDLDSSHANGYSFQIEMKYRALQQGMTVREIPIVFEDRRVGSSKMSPIIVAEALGLVWRLRWKGGRLL